MKKQQKEFDQSRRDLIKGVGSAAVVGAVTATVSKNVSAEEKVEDVVKPLQDGYHETQHIRDYYDTL